MEILGKGNALWQHRIRSRKENPATEISAKVCGTSWLRVYKELACGIRIHTIHGIGAAMPNEAFSSVRSTGEKRLM